MADTDLNPPSAERVLKRALVLAALSCRGIIEGDLANLERARGLSASLMAWLQDSGIEDELEPDETRLLHLPFGSLTQQQRTNMGWLAEGMVVLAWALGRTPLPPFWEQCNGGQISGALGMLRPDTKDSLAKALLRDQVEIDRGTRIYTSVDWRLVEFRLRQQKMDFAASMRNFERVPYLFLSAEGIALADGDVAINGIPIASIHPGRVQGAASIVHERHKAFNWLRGLERLYSTVRTDT